MDTRTAQALIRFGMGRKGDQPVPGDPAGWLTAQLDGPDPARFDGLPTTQEGLHILRAAREAKDLKPVRQLARAEATAQMANALTTDAPYRERLVWFWTNHFSVSLRKPDCQPVLGAMIREAVRPNVTGRFSDLLLAVMRHPAMLTYLDNRGSVGPGSQAGLRTGHGLNENLARECMELYTVSPASGYSQADVTSFAKILTGWTNDANQPGGFTFHPAAHEPGAKTLMGRSFPQGEQGGIQALAFLASHPSTHRFLATKLVRQFVADDPPPAAVATIAGVLRDSGGNLGAASRALVTLDAAWTPLAKLRAPQDYVVAVLRAVDLPPDQRPDVIGVLAAQGQPVWSAPAPNGWPDRAADWAGSEAIMRRVDWAYGLSGRAAQADPMRVADAALGPLLSPATADQVRLAGSRREALALLLASPEFMRR